MIKVAINGYGTIGKRVADAVAAQKDMKVIGVSKTRPNAEAFIAKQRGYPLYIADLSKKAAFEKAGLTVAGSVEDMLTLEQMDQNIFTSGEVSRVYQDIAPSIQLDILTHRRITDLISELNMLGVINTRVVSRGRYGRTKEMWFDANTNKIREVVLKDPRLNGLKDLDINQMEAKWLKTWFR